jgi:uncharacterized protein
MRYLAILTPSAGKSVADFTPLVVEEEVELWSMYRQELVREMCFDPVELAVSLTFEAAGKADVEKALQALPMVSSNLFNVKIIRQGPWLPVEALFKSDGQADVSVNVIRDIYDAVSNSDWDGVLAKIDTNIIFEQSSILPFAGVWKGHEGFQALGAAIFRAWPDFKVEPKSFFVTGNDVLVLTHVSGSNSRGEPPLDQTMIEYWRVADGKAVECRPHYFDPTAATNSANKDE